MKKNNIFFVGDFESNTGPANVNKMIKEVLGKKSNYSLCKNKITRMLELFFKIIISKEICFCSFSKINIYGIKFAKILNKKTFYLMHGYIKKENEFENNINEEDDKTEDYIIKNVTLVICVSKKFMEYMKNKYRNVSFYYVFNPINWQYIYNDNINKKKHQIISAGGESRLKNNLSVCEAIKQTKIDDIKYIIVGNSFCNKFEKYDFVELYETLPHNDFIKLIQQSELYIQNSYFETFGLAPIEALIYGCDLLISKDIGAIDLLKSIDERDIIFNNEDIDEIAKKICNVFNNHNNKRLIETIDNTTKENRIKQLVNIIKNKGEKNK